MPDLGTAYVNIVPKAPGIESNIEEVLNGGAAGAKKAGGGLGKKLIGGIAVGMAAGAAGLGALIKEGFEAGGALEQSFGGLDTLYGEASAAAKEYAAQAASAGISMNDYAEQAVSFGAALKQAYGGDTAAAAEAANMAILDMADNAAKMGTPLESLQTAYQGFAKQNYTMLDNLKLGYGGTKQEMERLLEDAQAITGIEYNIDNLGDVYSAIHVIQTELGLTGVAAAEAKETLSGSMNAMKASWENVMAAMATGEGLETAMAGMSESVQNFATNVFEMLENLSDQLPDFILGLANVVINNAPAFIKSGVELIVKLGLGLAQAIPDILSMIPELFSAVMEAILSVDWWSVGKDIIGGIIRGLWNAASGLWDVMKDLATRAWQSAKQALGIGSPSKVFADQIGRWIPAGMAQGIEDNLGPVDASVRMMTEASLANVQPFNPAAEQAPGAGTEMQQILEALRNLKLDLFLDGQQITDCVTVRQRRAVRSGGVA